MQVSGIVDVKIPVLWPVFSIQLNGLLDLLDQLHAMVPRHLPAEYALLIHSIGNILQLLFSQVLIRNFISIFK